MKPVFLLSFVLPSSLLGANRHGGLGIVINEKNQVTYANQRGLRLGFNVGEEITEFQNQPFRCDQAIIEIFARPSVDHRIKTLTNSSQKMVLIERENNKVPQDVSMIEKINQLLTCNKEITVLVVTTKVQSAFPSNPGWTDSMYSKLESDVEKTLLSIFGEYPNFQLVNRSNIEEILGELHLQQTGAVKPDTARKIGEITGANFAIFIEMSRFPTESSFLDSYTQKLVDLETSKIIAIANDKRDQGGRFLK